MKTEKHFREILDCRGSHAKSRINISSREWLGATWKLSIGNLINWTEQVLKERWHILLSRLSKINGTFPDYRYIKILTQRTKAKILMWHTLLQAKIFRLRPRWKNLTAFFGEKWVANSRKFKTNTSFRQFFNARIIERYVPADEILNWKCLSCPVEAMIVEETNIRKLEKFPLLTNVVRFFIRCRNF